MRLEKTGGSEDADSEKREKGEVDSVGYGGILVERNFRQLLNGHVKRRDGYRGVWRKSGEQ